MDEQASSSGGNPPPFFTNIKAWIAGTSGVVLALAGLVGAYKQLMPETKAEAATTIAAPAKAAEPVAAADLATKAEADLPMLYEGDDAKLEFVDDNWVLTTSEGEYEYREMYSPDEGRLLAFDRTNNAYLRWPIKGGMAEESTDGEETWKRWIKLYPPAPEEDAAG